MSDLYTYLGPSIGGGSERPALHLIASFNSGAEDVVDFGRDGMTITRGSSQIVTTGSVADAGTLETTLDNLDRHFDPNYASGPRFGDLVPGVPASAYAIWDSVQYQLLTGTVDDWPQDYPLDGADQLVHLRVTDGTGLFSNGSLYIQRGTDHSGTRVAAIAAALGWTDPTDIAAGNATINALKLSSITAWSHLADVANAEWGELYFSADGTLTFRSRDSILSDTRSTVSQATFVQNPAAGLNFSGATMGSPPIVNDCTITHNDKGDEVNAQDAGSIASPWKVHSLSLSLPLHTAAQAQQYAEWVVARYKTPIYTFKSITLTPSNEPGATYDLWAQALGRELGDLITVILDPLILSGNDRVLSGEPIERECWIRGIQHNFANEPWSTTFYLQDASWRTGLARFDVSDWDGGDVYAL